MGLHLEVQAGMTCGGGGGQRLCLGLGGLLVGGLAAGLPLCLPCSASFTLSGENDAPFSHLR